MTADRLPVPDAPLETISVDQMESYIAAGRAERWTQPIGELEPVAALLDGAWEQHDDEGNRIWVLRSGTWYVVWDDAESKDVYELAPPQLAAVLTDFLARLRTANDQVAQTDAQHGVQTGAPSAVDDEVVPTQRSPEP
jgi:hypothetical protein